MRNYPELRSARNAGQVSVCIQSSPLVVQCRKDHTKVSCRRKYTQTSSPAHTLSLSSVTRTPHSPNASYALLRSRYLLLPFLQGTLPRHAQNLPLLNPPLNPANTTPFLSLLLPLPHNTHVSHKAMPNLPTCPVPLILANDNWQQVHAMLCPPRHATAYVIVNWIFHSSVHFVGSFLQGRRGGTASFFKALCVHFFTTFLISSVKRDINRIPLSGFQLNTQKWVETVQDAPCFPLAIHSPTL